MTWRVELSRDAAEAVRALPAAVRRPVADTLDALARKGLPDGASPVGDEPEAYLVSAGTHELLVVVRRERQLLVVARVEAADALASGPAVRALPLPARIRSRLARLVGDALMDCRLALRTFRRSPGSVAAVTLTLALGLGGTTALFGVMNTVFNAALPFEEGDRLVRLRDYSRTASGGVRGYNMSPRNFEAIREGNRVFEGVVAQESRSLSLTGGEQAERAAAIEVSAGWTRTLEVEPILGRTFTPEEEALGNEAGVALISHGLWQRRFGAEPDIVGREIRYDGGTLAVVGVMPPRFHFPYDADLWMPRRFDASRWQAHDLNVMARMRDGVTLEDVRADMDRLYAALKDENPGTTPDTGIEVREGREYFIEDDAQVLQGLMAAVGLLLLLACLNVANLLTARFMNRRREIGIRAALGAGRGRQLRQFLTETVLLFLVGGGLGVLLTAWFGDLLTVLIPHVLREQLDLGRIRMEPELLGFALLLSVGTGLVFGFAAATRAARPDLQSLLKQGGRGTTGADRRLQAFLVAGQLALSLVLLVGAGVLFDHVQRLQGLDPGFDIERVATARLTVDQERYADPDARIGIVRSLQERVDALPEVQAVGASTVNPLCCGDWGAVVEIEGREPPPDEPNIYIHHRYVTPGYFDAMGIHFLRGRNFSPTAGPDSPRTVIIDDRMARRFWPGENPVGKRIRMDRPGRPWRTVVGVVGWVEKEGDYTETWYLPYYQTPVNRSTENLHLMIRSTDESVLDAVRRAVGEVDPALPLFEASSMEALQDIRLSQDRFGTVVATIFAAFGLLLGGLGVYGLLSFTVSIRSREIGTRIALGADRRRVLTMVLRRALVLVGAGSVVGIVLALGLNQMLERLVLGVRMAEPGLLAGLVGTLVFLAVTAALVPALRAARIDPVRAFRE